MFPIKVLINAVQNWINGRFDLNLSNVRVSILNYNGRDNIIGMTCTITEDILIVKIIKLALIVN